MKRPSRGFSMHIPRTGETRSPVLRRVLSPLVVLMLLGGSVGSLGSANQAMAQQGMVATPVPGSTQTTSPGMGQQSSAQDIGTGPGFPAVLAQGLVYAPGTDIVWSAEERKLPTAADAVPMTGQASILFQRGGSALVRNDVTAKRALITSGAAFFIAGGDSYTVSGSGTAPVGWSFAIGNATDVASDAFYESPKISNVPEGSYPMTLTRYVLRSDEEASIGSHTGPALVMVVAGQVEADAGSGPVSLAVNDGQLIANDGKVHNTGNSPAVYVVLALGGPVSDDTAGAPQAPAAPAATVASVATIPVQETPAAANPSEPTPSTADSVPGPSSSATGRTDANGNFVASINITADAPIYVTLTADGVVVFDGPLDTGQMTGAVVASVYQVSTSIGASTQFTDGCGRSFYMGAENGPASYTLTADANSCSPQ
jgi:hypothetical protein